MNIKSSLKLLGEDIEDVLVVSSLFQDSLVFNRDIKFEVKEKLFYLVANRFCWEEKSKKNKEKNYHRVLTGLKFLNVSSVKYKGIDFNKKQFLNFLYLEFNNKKKVFNLTFSNDKFISIKVKKIKIIVKDLSIPHPSFLKPTHPI